VRALTRALNVAYGEKEKRAFIERYGSAEALERAESALRQAQKMEANRPAGGWTHFPRAEPARGAWLTRSQSLAQTLTEG